MENAAQPELCRLHTLRIANIDKRGIWLEAGNRSAHLPLREAPKAVPGEQLEVFLFQVVAGELQATCRRPLAQAGEFALLKVRTVDNHGAFLDWGLAKDLLVPFGLQPERMQVGRSYLVKVDLDQQDRPFGNANIESCLDQTQPDLHEGEPVDMLVWQFTELGAKVIVNHRYPALLYRDELPAGTDTGMQLSGYVKRLREDGKLDVTLRKVGAEAVNDARDVILKALAANNGSLPLHDGSSPAIIKQILGMSKKTFKKAVGSLYKEGVVKLTNEGVTLKVRRVRTAETVIHREERKGRKENPNNKE
jgi:predicted RNA-binding protein (virulence factor B family)